MSNYYWTKKSWADEEPEIPVATCALPEHVRVATEAAFIKEGDVLAAESATHAGLLELAARDRVRTAATPNFKPTEDEEKRQELREKQGKLLESFYEKLKGNVEMVLKYSSCGQSYWLLGKYSLPTDKVRRECPETAYWAGVDGDVRRAGVPIVQLLQGVRDHKTGLVYPELLPGGKTVVTLLNDSLKEQGLVCGLFKRGNEFYVYAGRPGAMPWESMRAAMQCSGSGFTIIV